MSCGRQGQRKFYRFSISGKFNLYRIVFKVFDNISRKAPNIVSSALSALP